MGLLDQFRSTSLLDSSALFHARHYRFRVKLETLNDSSLKLLDISVLKVLMVKKGLTKSLKLLRDTAVNSNRKEVSTQTLNCN